MKHNSSSIVRRPLVPAYFLGRPTRVYLQRFATADRVSSRRVAR